MLTLTNVRKTFGRIVAVDGLSLSVRKGEVLGLLAPESGTVTIEGYGNPAVPEVRLRLAPLTNVQIPGGKALACFVAIVLVEVMLLGVASAFGVQPTSYAMLGLAGVDPVGQLRQELLDRGNGGAVRGADRARPGLLHARTARTQRGLNVGAGL